jgi:23S rRNA (pseudouridine1915-N3)-methyltransferase
MDITIISIGKWKASPEKELFTSYRQRLPWPVELIELPSKELPDAQRQKADEAQRMRETYAQWPNAKRIVLDERGQALTSRDLADRIRGWRDEQAVRKLVVLVGGHAGLDPSLRQQADLCLSFGQLTWPHLLVRTLIAEQLYRCYSILTNHPYHRD